MRMKKVRRCLALALSVGLIFADVAPTGAAEIRADRTGRGSR